MTSGNWTHRDPIEGWGASRGENRWRATRERTLGLTNLSTKRQRIAELARSKSGVAFTPTCAPFLTDESRTASVRCCERSSPVKNRKREIRTSGSVRGEDGNILNYSASVRINPGKGEEDVGLGNLSSRSRGFDSLAAKVSQPAGSESCMGGGNTTREA